MSRWALGDKFDTVYPHKGSIKVLWDTRWKLACQRSVYPFHDGCYEDFEPIFQKLTKDNVNDADSDDYTNAFLPTASSLESQAEDALDSGQSERALELFRRAAVVYRIARYPYVDVTQPTSLKSAVFKRQKQVYMKAASLLAPPIKEETLTHSYSSGNDNQQIPIYVRIPESARPESPVPVVLLMTGLDGYRPDNTQRTQEAISRGWATVIVEIPGTADCPADPADPSSPDRLWDSVFAYLENEARLDSNKVVAWGLSAGGFYAIRAAHTHRNRLVGAIAHGPGCHFFLDPEWLSRVDDHEYPFTLTPAWAKKHGYSDVEAFKSEAQNKFSLVRNGIVDQPSCRLLLLNGVDDGVVPIEDCYVLFSHGTVKEGRFFEGLPHMGYPHSLPVAYTWFEDLLSPPAAAKN